MVDVINSFDGLSQAWDNAKILRLSFVVVQILAILFLISGSGYFFSIISKKKRVEETEDKIEFFIGLVIYFCSGLAIIFTTLYPIETSGSVKNTDTVRVDSVIFKDDVASLNYKYKGKQHSFDICLPNDDNSDLDYKLDGKEFSDDVTVTQFDDDEIKSLLKKVQSKKLVPYLELTESRERKIKINVGLLNLFFNSKEDVTSKYELSRIGVKFKESNVPNFSEDFK